MRRPLPRPGGDRRYKMFLEKILDILEYVVRAIIWLLWISCGVCSIIGIIGYFTIIF